MDRHLPGRAWRQSANRLPQHKSYTEGPLPKENQCGNRDCWIEWYLSFLERELSALGGGLIGKHYFACASAAYAEFRSAGTQQARFRSWLGIRTCCAWLAQLERAES